MQLPTPDELRARFAELAADREAILAASAPIRAERDQVSAEADDKVAKFNARIARKEEGLFELDTEMAAIARALGGRTSVE
jgi:uncharacterized coiled-coil DUF342 family protein